MNISERLYQSIKNALPKALKTSWWLIKITLPVAFMVFVLEQTGALKVISETLSPLFRFMGLPGESALVLLTSIFTNVYSVVAVMSTLSLGMRETIILAVMCLISHAIIPETIIQKKAGSSATQLVILRLTMSFVAAIILNFILPDFSEAIKSIAVKQEDSFSKAFQVWGSSMLYLSLKISLIVCGLLILQNILEDFGFIRHLSRLFKPLIVMMGLPESTTLSWLVANLIGLSYGSAILLREVDEKKMNTEEANLLNQHTAISHSQLEDPLLFLPLGLPLLWLIIPRVILGICAVWGYRFITKMRQL